MKKIFVFLFVCLILCCSCSNEVLESISESESSKSSSSCGENTEKIIVEGSYLEHLYKKDIKSINCYYGTGAAVLNDGSAVFWGTNVYGGIGNGEVDNDIPEGEKATPVPPYRHCFDEPVIDAGSQTSSYALTESGNLYT